MYYNCLHADLSVRELLVLFHRYILIFEYKCCNSSQVGFRYMLWLQGNMLVLSLITAGIALIKHNQF